MRKLTMNEIEDVSGASTPISTSLYDNLYVLPLFSSGEIPGPLRDVGSRPLPPNPFYDC